MVSKLEKAAAAGYAMPDGLTAPDQLRFLTLRQIYRDYRQGTSTKARAAAEKQQINRQCDQYAAQEAITRLFPDTVKRTEQDRLFFHRRKAAGATNKELLSIACRIIHAATGDGTF